MFKDIKWVELGCLSTPAVGIRNHRDLKLNGFVENMFWVVSRLVGNSKVILQHLLTTTNLWRCARVAKGHGWLPGILRLTVAPDQGRG